MTSISLGRSFLWILLVPAGLIMPAVRAHADDEPVWTRIQELNKATGVDAMNGELAILAKDPKAEELVHAAVKMIQEKQDSLSYNAALVLARVAELKKDIKSSEALYRACNRMAAKLQSADKILQSYGGLIDMLYNAKKYAESVNVCRELLELKLDDGKEREVLVGSRSPRGDVEYIPDENFDPVKRLRSGVFRLMIQAVAKQGKYKQALKMADKLIRDRDGWLERAAKGWVQREAGQYAEATKTYEDVLSRVKKDKTIDPEDREEYQDQYHYILSNIYLEENNLSKATEHLEALLKRHPDNAGYNNDLGYIWADHDVKLPEAEKLITKALDLDRKRRESKPGFDAEKDRDNGAYLDSLGWVYFKQKKYKEAKDVLLKAVEDKDSQHIEIYDHLGDVYMALGQRDEAIKTWRKGLEFAGENRRDRQRRAIVEKKLEMAK